MSRRIGRALRIRAIATILLRRSAWVAMLVSALVVGTAGSARAEAVEGRESGAAGVAAAAATFGRPSAVDGTLEAEWKSADRFDLAASVAEALGGGTVPARLYVMNDSDELFLAFDIAHTNPVSISLQFDPIRPGFGGMDGLSFWTLPNPFFWDYHLCSWEPPNWCLDLNEAAMEWSHGGGRTFIEIVRPLQTADGHRDLQLKAGERVRLGLIALVTCPDTRPEACRGPIWGSQEIEFTVAADAAPPRVQALPTRGRRGRTARLRFRVDDNDGAARAVVEIKRRGRLLTTLRTDLIDARGRVSSVSWRIPPTARAPLSFCVSAADKAGNESAASCAAVTLTH